jgi:hypothetical protein
VVGAAAAGRCLLERELGRGGVAAVDAAAGALRRGWTVVTGR